MSRNRRFVVRGKSITVTHELLKGVNLNNEDIQILGENGHMIIKVGASNDGVSPTLNLGRFGVIGPPNGPVDLETGLPITAPAVLAHDMLLRYREEIGLTYRQIHAIFGDLIMQTGWIWRGLYRYLAIWFGPGGKIRGLFRRE